MADQFSFPGFEDAPPLVPKPKPLASAGKAPYSLFFSFFPPAQDIAAIAALTARLKQEHGLAGKPLLPHRLHITLMDLGNYQEVPDDVIAAARAAADAVRCQAFDLVLDRALSYPSSRTYVLNGHGQDLDAIRAFRESLRESVLAQGLCAGKSFTPHMTLMYDPARIAEHAVEPVRLRVQEFVLIRSHVGKGIYDPLGRWTLRA